MTYMKEAASDKRGDPEYGMQDDDASNKHSLESGFVEREEETPSVSKSEQDEVSEETGILPDERDGMVDNKVWTSLSDE